MRRRAPRPGAETGAPGDGPADTATVVIGIDGSTRSRAALHWGCREARWLGGRAIAVLISPEVEDLAAEILCEAGGLDVTFIHAPGDPVSELLRIAGKVHADLIVVGGSAAIPHRLRGSVGQRLAGRRRGPVIVVVPRTLLKTIIVCNILSFLDGVT